MQARVLRPSLRSLHKVIIVALEFRQAHALLIKPPLSFFNFLLLANLLYSYFTPSYEFTTGARENIPLETAANIVGSQQEFVTFLAGGNRSIFGQSYVFCKMTTQCFSYDWQIAKATWVLTRFHFSGIYGIFLCQRRRKKKNKSLIARLLLLLTGVENFHIAKLKPRFEASTCIKN